MRPKYLPWHLKSLRDWRWALVIAFVSGLGMGLTPAPVNAWLIAWGALAPLWLLTQVHIPKMALLLGAAWGVGYHGAAIAWITGIHPMTWLGVPWLASLAIAAFCWIAITLWGAALVAVWAWAMALYRWIGPPKTSTWTRVLVGVALWCGLEWIWSQSPLWWTSLSYTQSPHNLAILHLGQLSGPLTVTAALVLINGLVAEVLSTKGRWQSMGWVAIVLVSLHILGFGLYSQPLDQPPATALKVGIIQGNIPNEIKLYSEGGRRALEGYTNGYRALAEQGVEAVLTPETALPFLWTSSSATYSSFQRGILEQGVVAWVGAIGQQGKNITNSLFTITGQGEIFSRYDKVNLVPVGEYIPFQRWLGSLIERLSPLDAHLVPGSPDQTFDTPFGQAITGICYDSAFAEHFRRQTAAGGEFLLSASNNAHYSSAMPAQHHAQDVMRAIESDRWAVRATNTGYSGIVDPHGNTHWLSGLNTYQIHADKIYRRHTQTPYVRWGDWLTPLLSVLAIGTWVMNRAGWREQ